MTGRYYKKPRCGWRNQVGRSQPGDWHVSVGDEVKAAFQQLCENPYTHIDKYAKCHKQTKPGRHSDGHKEGERALFDVSTDAEQRQIAPFEGKAKSNVECDFCHRGVRL